MNEQMRRDRRINEADRRIRNFVWNSSFANPSTPPSGWVAQPLIHLLGDILQDDGVNQVGHLVPAPIQPIRRIRDTIWSTGKDWTTAFFGAPESNNAEEMTEVKGLRMLLRYSKGLRTRWEQRGLRCEFKTIAKESMMKMRESRRSARGDYIAEAVGHRQFKDMDLWSACGRRLNANKDFKELLGSPQRCRIGEILEVQFVSVGELDASLQNIQQMADGGANYARDKKQSVMVNWALQPNPHPLQAVILAAIDGDIPH
ncbi:unnamed protein product [Phytophthora lilii]|uniref:Unnamed protein product n=1 Tax=Phytophthora lilii TaxID=2077276 RepID=A0A9W6XGF8_9STRA|nr:unnamed protein product [Phytophthora lilii]